MKRFIPHDAVFGKTFCEFGSAREGMGKDATA